MINEYCNTENGTAETQRLKERKAVLCVLCDSAVKSMKKIKILFFLILFSRAVLCTVEINNKNFNRIYFSESEPEVLFEEKFEDVWNWSMSHDGKASVNLSNERGHADKCLNISYDFRNKGEWCNIGKRVDLGKLSDFSVSMYLKSEKANHVFEVKLEDDDGTIYGCLITIDESFNDWKEVKLNPEDIGYLWGGNDKKLDNINRINFAVNGRNHYEEGEILIDSFRIFKEKDDFAECTLSQVGYHRDDKKYAVLRICSDRKFPDKIKYSILSGGNTMQTGFFVLNKFDRWKGRYFLADFSELQDYGKYKLEIDIIPGHKLVTNEFDIDENILFKNVIPKVYHFINYMRCGKNCHKYDPILGGYHDTHYDIGKRMWSLTHLITGMVLTIKNAPDIMDTDNNNVDDRIDELLYALDFALKVQLPDGGVDSFGIGHTKFVDNTKFNFSEDTNPRVLGKNSAVNTTCYYAGALAYSYALLKDKYPELSEKLLDGAVKAWKYLDSKYHDTSYALGGYIYASTELYRITKDEKYLKNILQNLNRLQKLQDLDCSNKENNVCGEFFLSASKKEYEYQYKFFEYNLEIFLGLVNTCNIFDYRTEEWLKSMYVLRIFYDIYIKRMSSLTPYNQMAHGLEIVGGKYEIAFFPPPTQPWTGAHGFNCDHFAHGYLAMLIGYITGDLSCEEFADSQMQWVLGNNPLRYCMVCGVGYNNPVVWSMYHNKGGPIDGEIPNGLIGYGLPFPIWKGADYNSGENWLPHNAYCLVLSALLDTEPQLSGRVIGKNTGKVEIQYDNKIIESLVVSDDGSFGPVDLRPERKYILKYSDNGAWVQKNISLLSGEKKYVTLNLGGEYEIKINVIKNKKGKSKIEFEITNMSSSELNPELLIRTYDGDETAEEKVAVLLKSGKTKKFRREYKTENKNPLLVACNDKTALLPFE